MKVVLAQVLKIAMLAVLSNHTYQFGGEIRLQRDDGPIGLELVGAMARVTMIWWDKKFLYLAATNDVTLYFYMRYVDDQNTAGKPLEAGRRWEVGPWASGLGGKRSTGRTGCRWTWKLQRTSGQ